MYQPYHITLGLYNASFLPNVCHGLIVLLSFRPFVTHLPDGQNGLCHQALKIVSRRNYSSEAINGVQLALIWVLATPVWQLLEQAEVLENADSRRNTPSTATFTAESNCLGFQQSHKLSPSSTMHSMFSGVSVPMSMKTLKLRKTLRILSLNCQCLQLMPGLRLMENYTLSQTGAFVLMKMGYTTKLLWSQFLFIPMTHRDRPPGTAKCLD